METLDLSKLLGTWLIEGLTRKSKYTTDTGLAGRETFEWMQGDQFLIHRLDGKLGHSPMACIDVTSRDGTCHAFYNDGSQRRFTVREQADGSLTYVEDGAFNRCTMKFLPDGTREVRWETSTDGQTWRVYWESTARHAT